MTKLKRLVRRFMSIITAVGLVAGLFIATPPTASAAKEVDCQSDASLMGEKIPLVMAHGLFGKPNIWDGLSKVLNEVKDVYIATPFDYSANLANINWVTHPNVGPKLAKTVACLADASKKNGGPGKVLIIGHSMGGLAAQYAAAQVPNKVGLVITIGTPHKGSILANAMAPTINSLCSFSLPSIGGRKVYITPENCKKSLAFAGLSIDSEELEKLPPFPPNVPVKAIAGNITPQMQLGMVKITGAPLHSDAVVHTPSALGTFTTMGKGDGKREVSCTGFLVFPSMSDASCEHSQLVNDSQVQASIEQYIAATNVPAIDFFGLMLRPGPEWQLVKGGEFDTESRKTLVDAACEFPETPAGCNETIIMVNTNGPENMDPYGDSQYKTRDKDCYWDKLHEDGSFGSPVTVGSVMVDGEKAEHQVLTGCNLSGGTPEESTSQLHIWRIPSRGVLVYIVLFGTEGAEQQVETVKKLLQSASWG
ncbi:MAG TPA: alpha/beta fold hydrolase [Candidatus Saccharimonadales bacterium]|nr:alpha/beta fold hydrolase [Candidatus Saccharimonadales bacterium]